MEGQQQLDVADRWAYQNSDSDSDYDMPDFVVPASYGSRQMSAAELAASESMNLALNVQEQLLRAKQDASNIMNTYGGTPKGGETGAANSKPRASISVKQRGRGMAGSHNYNNKFIGRNTGNGANLKNYGLDSGAGDNHHSGEWVGLSRHASMPTHVGRSTSFRGGDRHNDGGVGLVRNSSAFSSEGYNGPSLLSRTTPGFGHRESSRETRVKPVKPKDVDGWSVATSPVAGHVSKLELPEEKAVRRIGSANVFEMVETEDLESDSAWNCTNDIKETAEHNSTVGESQSHLDADSATSLQANDSSRKFKAAKSSAELGPSRTARTKNNANKTSGKTTSKTTGTKHVVKNPAAIDFDDATLDKLSEDVGLKQLNHYATTTPQIAPVACPVTDAKSREELIAEARKKREEARKNKPAVTAEEPWKASKKKKDKSSRF